MTGLVALVLVELFAIATMSNISFCDATFYMGCLESERVALIKLKQDFKDPSNHLASWIGDVDCCEWGGVVCNNITGHVLELNLERSELGGEINPALVDLKHLNLLDLSGNDFQGIQIPVYIGSMDNPRYLNLSGAGFAGWIPTSVISQICCILILVGVIMSCELKIFHG